MKAGYQIQESRSWMCDVPEDESRLMKSYAKHFRNQVRQAHQRGGVIELNTPIDREEVYELYKMTMARNDLSPRYSIDEIAYVLNWSNDMKDLYLCKYEGKLGGFLISLKFNKVSIDWLAGMDRRYAEFRPMNLLFHELLRQSVVQEMRTVDLGGGVTEGVIRFKERRWREPNPIFSLYKPYSSHLYLTLALAWAAGPKRLVRKAVSPLFESRPTRRQPSNP